MGGPGDVAAVGGESLTAEPVPVELTFAATDVWGASVFEGADSFTDIKNLVDQAIEKAHGTCIKHLNIVAHGADGTDGFVELNPDRDDKTDAQSIDGGTRTPLIPGGTPDVRDQLQRLSKHLCPGAIIEFRTCRFGIGDKGTKAMQAVADVTGATVTAPMGSIKSIAGLGGLATDWKTVYPSSTGLPPVVSFWRGVPAPQSPQLPIKDAPPVKSVAPQPIVTTPPPPQPVSLGQAVGGGLVLIDVRGAGENVTSRVSVELRNLTGGPIRVVIPRGTQFTPAAEGHQTMVTTEETVIDVPVGGQPVPATIPTLCGSPFGYKTPPPGGGIGYSVPPLLSPITGIMDTVDCLGDDFTPLAGSIGMPLPMFGDTVQQYSVWWLYGNPGRGFDPGLQDPNDPSCPACHQDYRPGSLCPHCGFFPLPAAPPPPQPVPPFTPATITDILGPQLSSRGATPDQVKQIATTFWEGIETTVKAVNRDSPATIGKTAAAGAERSH